MVQADTDSELASRESVFSLQAVEPTPEGEGGVLGESDIDADLLIGLPWFALFVRPRHEKFVQRVLDCKGYLTSLPLRKCTHARRNGSDWENEKPLISRYVFVRHDPDNRFHMVTTPGVVHIVRFGNEPCPIPWQQIEALERIAASGLPTADWVYPGIGDTVKLIEGPLKGLEGVMTRARSATRLVVSVPMLQRSVAVEIDCTWVIRVQPAFETSTPVRALTSVSVGQSRRMIAARATAG